jgi:hypothetical protein
VVWEAFDITDFGQFSWRIQDIQITIKTYRSGTSFGVHLIRHSIIKKVDMQHVAIRYSEGMMVILSLILECAESN